MSYYTVKVGESIGDVCLNSTGSLINWDAILQANGFTDWTPQLTVGQQIYIPDGVNTTLQLQSNVQRILAKYPAVNNAQNSVSQIKQNNIPNPLIFGGMIIGSVVPGNPYVLILPQGTLLTRIAFKNNSNTGNVTVKIGKTAGGSEVMPAETFGEFLDIQNPAIMNGSNYTPFIVMLYFTVISGNCKIRVDATTNYI